MLDTLDLTKRLDKESYKEKMAVLQPKLSQLQRDLKELQVPVMIAFEGYGAAGKGRQIAELIKALDPRGFVVYPVKNATPEEEMHPFLWRFWTKMPARGRIAIYDSSWYRRVLQDRFEGKVSERAVADGYESIRSFERQLTDDGMVLLKIFLAVSPDEQKRRFDKLRAEKDTAWRVTKADLKRNKRFAEYTRMNEEMLSKTDTSCAPWNLVPANDRRYATWQIYELVTAALEKVVELKQLEANKQVFIGAEPEEYFTESVLDKYDLSVTLEQKTYEAKLKKLQKRISWLHNELYRRRIPVIIGFEGWDAGGKGGAIKRLTEKMDPRGYVVHPTASPNEVEQAHHYLWRFWQAVPKAGHLTIFDRTWYGRVLVERIEGFASRPEWKRAYKEINDMERDWTTSGYIVLKFWLQIDKEEQRKRFEERMADPAKQWKITDEDWRNREKWDAYEAAVNEMLIRTSTPQAPWTVVEGNDKYYARIKVLETVVQAIEERLKNGAKDDD